MLCKLFRGAKGLIWAYSVAYGFLSHRPSQKVVAGLFIPSIGLPSLSITPLRDRNTT